MKLKALALVAAVLMTASCFAACTKNPDPISSDEPSSSDQSSEDDSSSDEGNNGSEHKQIEITDTPVTTLDYKATSIDTSEPVELLFYQYDEIKEDSQEVFDKLNEMSAADINTTVDFQWADGTKAGLIIQTDEPYDMIYTCAWQNNYVATASNGSYAPLEDILPSVAPTLYNFLPENVWKGATVKGHIYCVPVFKDVAGTLMWIFNAGLLEEAGITDEMLDAAGPDPDSITPILKALKEKTDLDGGYDVFHGEVNVPFDFINRGGAGYGLPYLSEDSTVISHLEDPAIVHNVRVATKWNKAGYIYTDRPDGAWSPVSIGQGWLGCEPAWRNNDHGDVVVRVRYDAYYTTDSVLGACNAISYQSENIERALLWFQWINCNSTARDIYAYGIEGKHWNKNANGVVEKTDAGNNKYAVSAFAQATFYTLTPQAPNKIDGYSKLLENCIQAPPSLLLGFTADTTEVETQIAAQNLIWSKYSNILYRGGYEDPDAQIAKILEEFKGAGLDEVKAEFQSQVDKFLAEKE